MRAQYSLEIIVVLAISTAILVPAVYIFYDFILTSIDGIVRNQITNIGLSFKEHANLVHNYGKDARIVLQINFPDRIQNMSVDNNSTLSFVYGSRYGPEGLVFPFGFNVSEDFSAEDYSMGEKRFEFSNEGGGLVSIRRV